MEDFSVARRSAELANISGLQNEWMESQQLSGKVELAGGDGKPGKDVADRLDRELKEFANSEIPNSSGHMKEFQKLVTKFGEAENKKAAVGEFGPAAAKLRVKIENEASENVKKMDAEAAKDPGRAKLNADFSDKNNKFFDQASKLPFKEYNRILTLFEARDGESQAERTERIREGLKNNPKMLNLYNDAEAAREKVEQAKGPVEKEAEQEYKRNIAELKTIKAIVRKVAIRSDIDSF